MDAATAAGLSDQDRAWFHSQFMAWCIRRTSFAWQDFVTSLMHARYGGRFLQVDPSFRGDKGCDGYIEGLMLACYGASRPESKYVAEKVRTDFVTAHSYWRDKMKRWAFVHNNASGLPLMAHEAVTDLGIEFVEAPVKIEVWPPQVLWDETGTHLTRSQLADILGAPPSDHPAGMSYVARCVESLARTRLRPELDDVESVPYGKIEHNRFGEEVTNLILTFKAHTSHVRYYYSQASPGEQAQAAENLRGRFDKHRAKLRNSDAVFHALCDDLIAEAFGAGAYGDKEQQRSAAIMVVTHFFETCEIFAAPGEVIDHAPAVEGNFS